VSTTYAVNGRPTTVDDFASTLVAVQNTGAVPLLIEPLGRTVDVGATVTVPGWSTRRTRVRTAGQNGTAVVTLTAGSPAVAPGPGGVTFDPGPASAMSITVTGGTWYSNEGLTTAVSFPVSITAATVLYPAAAGSITITAVVGGTTQVRGMNVNEGSSEAFVWTPSTDAERAAAGVSAGSGTYAKIPSPAGVAFVGDSIVNNSGTFDGSSNPSPRYECRAWMEWARAINGASWERVGPSDKYGWATGGYTTDQIIAAGYHTSAASSSATIVAVLAGTNDLAAQTAAYVLTNLQALWAPSLAAGKTVIACTLLPRSDQIVKVDAVNLLIRRACATTKNLVLCDMYGAMVDPSTGAPLTTRSDDGVHPNLAGAGAMGVVFAQVMASLVPAGSPPDVRIEASADAITRNPFGLGNASGLPTNWSKFNLGSGSAVATKVARTDAGGEWTNLVVTSAAPNADGIQLQVAQPSQKWAIGDTLRAVAELDITAGFDLRGLMLYAYGNAATAQAYWGYRSSSDGTALTAGAPVSGRLWLVTPVWTVPGTATGSMTVNLQVYGPGTIRVGRMGIVRV
jgi:hypothetical protein